VAPAAAAPARRIENVFQISLVLLLANGFFAILFTGRLDPFISAVMIAALVARLLAALGVVQFELPKRAVTLLSLSYIVFYPLDYLLISHAFVPPTVRMMLFFTAVKMLSATTGRDYFYLGLLAFLHLLAASMFVPGAGYLGILLLFLCLGTTAVVSYEVKRGCESGARVIEGPNQGSTSLGARLATASVAMAAGILMLSVVLFLVLPRVMGRAPISPFGIDPMIGFSSEVDLGATGALQPDNTPVMRVQGLEEDIHQRLWRGVALTHFDGRRWSSRPRSQLVETGSYAMPRRWHHSQTGKKIHYRIVLEPLASQALFVTGVPEQIISGSFDRLVVDETDSLRVLDGGMQAVQYEVASWVTERSLQRPADVAEVFSTRFRDLYLQLPEVDPRVGQLARQVTASRTNPLSRAEALESYLRSGFGYTLDLPMTRHDDPLAHFLFERRQGHCEYFASAMAVMLRSLGIPSRLVNGFAGGIDNPISGLHVIRSRDAHSWVEAYIPSYGWIEFDPTPPAPDAMMNPWMAQLWMYWDALQSGWSDWVLEYDFAHQIQLARTVQSHTRGVALYLVGGIEQQVARARKFWETLLPAADGSIAGGQPLIWTGIGAGIAALLVLAALFRFLIPVWKRAQRGRRLRAGRGLPSDSAFFYQRALAVLERRGIPRRPWQTAEEFSRSAEAAEFRGLLDQITAAYNAARYGRDRDAAERLPRLVQALERARL
jgi:transglutaminase-like putative cysteine protease